MAALSVLLPARLSLLVPCLSLQLLGLSVLDPDTGAFTLAAYARAFGVGVYTRIIGTTFLIALEGPPRALPACSSLSARPTG